MYICAHLLPQLIFFTRHPFIHGHNTLVLVYNVWGKQHNATMFSRVPLVLMPCLGLTLSLCVPRVIFKTWGTFYLNEFVVNPLK